MGGCVLYEVALGGAAALESMVDVEPMSDLPAVNTRSPIHPLSYRRKQTYLVNSRPAKIIRRGTTPRNGRGLDYAPVAREDGRVGRDARLGEVAVPQGAVAVELGRVDKVDVEGAVGAAPAEGALHVQLVIAGGPVAVDGEGGVKKGEGDGGGAEGFVHDGELLVDLGFLEKKGAV